MLRFPLAALAATLAIAIVTATHSPVGRCGSDGYPAAGIVEFTGGEAETTFYVDDRNYPLANGIWIYAESNGVWTPQGTGVYAGSVTDHNLQRGSACGGWSGSITDPAPACFVPDDGEICTDPSEAGPDLLIF